MFFLDNYGLDPLIINGDQMLLHRNENSSQKPLTFTGIDTYVKENCSPSGERVMDFPQLCWNPSMPRKSEFIFKGKGTLQNFIYLNVLSLTVLQKGSIVWSRC